ncbi:MAG: hypothetical protein E2P03_11735 [Acidobacteria bacterium]|nr:MAG: hypothetical protein E2P03_11735 [Acidobacteriota bacterium]
MASRESLPARLGWLILFAVAFGFLEGAVVVYLRAIYYPDGFGFPLLLAADRIARVELARELATLLMLLGVAGLAARRPWGRFGAFAVAFGVWDLVYYLALKVMLGWPASLATWDVLFLIPGIWTGPVWAALDIAVLLVVCGARIMAVDAEGYSPRPGWLDWLGCGISLALLLTAFLWNHSLVEEGGVPVSFPWWFWVAGVAVALATFLRVFVLAPKTMGYPPATGLNR